ncbi:hypothetical protein QBC36DRAFT_294375 [Triangularia setosa]|uniref:Uncharacterized protein n=1 Tax=Triangularia setosa TaxID=2587417 RepID=A0AAN6VZA1_9PEZI|nr:hypothetical protein QBC36DRAFT_294375 [Podospora setosa]
MAYGGLLLTQHLSTAPDLNLADFPAPLQSSCANRLLYVVTLCLTRYAIYFIFTVIRLTIATVFICVLKCQPPSAYWNVEAQLSGAALAVCMDPKQRQNFFEAIVPSAGRLHPGTQLSGEDPSLETKNNAIVMNSEFTMELSETTGSLNGDMHKGHIVPQRLR